MKDSEVDYNQVMEKIDGLMVKGSDGVSKEELEEIQTLAQLAQTYEQTKYKIETL